MAVTAERLADQGVRAVLLRAFDRLRRCRVLQVALGVLPRGGTVRDPRGRDADRLLQDDQIWRPFPLQPAAAGSGIGVEQAQHLSSAELRPVGCLWWAFWRVGDRECRQCAA